MESPQSLVTGVALGVAGLTIYQSLGLSTGAVAVVAFGLLLVAVLAASLKKKNRNKVEELFTSSASAAEAGALGPAKSAEGAAYRRYSSLIGNTPLLDLTALANPKVPGVKVLAKAEVSWTFNSGSSTPPPHSIWTSFRPLLPPPLASHLVWPKYFCLGKA